MENCRVSAWETWEYSVQVPRESKFVFWVDSLLGIETSSIKKGWTWCWTCSRLKDV